MGRGRLVVVAVAALVAAVAGGLADWSGSSAGYTVQAGDTLWAIAQAHGLTLSQLTAANGLDPNAILPIGKHLYLPASSATAASASNPLAAPLSSSGSSSYSPASSWSFCSTFQPSAGPAGVLPAALSASPARLALQPVFRQWANRYGVSLALLEAVDWQESGWQQNVVSPTGAVGIGQIEPSTATFIQTLVVGLPLNLTSTSDNIRMSAAFLAYLAGIEGNNRCATIAAYYEGPVNLSAYGVPPGVQAYVANVEALMARFE